MSLKNKKAKLDNGFCVSPHHEIHVDLFGQISFCCQHEKGLFGNIRDITAIDAFHSKDYAQSREDTLNDTWAKGCGNCIQSEKKSNWSHRFSQQMEFDNPELGIDSYALNKFSIDFSNACNLRCTMCSPIRSTGWYKDATLLKKHLKKDVGKAVAGHGMDFTINHSLPLKVVDENLDTLLSAKLIDVSGGEPFYQEQFLYMVDKLVEHNYKGRLKIITNLTLITDEHIEKLQKINTTLLVSLDAISDLYEYIRPSTPFGKYKGHLMQQKVRELYTKFDLGISYTPQLLNLYNIKEYIYWVSKFRSNTHLNQWFNGALVGPNYLSLSVHPDIEYKNKLAHWLEQYLEDNNLGEHTILNPIITLLKKTRTKEDIDNWKFFCKTIDILDKHRKTSILNYVPELEKYWIKV